MNLGVGEGARAWRVVALRRHTFVARLFELEQHPKLPFLVWKPRLDLGPTRATEASALLDGEATEWQRLLSIHDGQLVWATNLVLKGHEESIWRYGAVKYIVVWARCGSKFSVALARLDDNEDNRYVLHRKLCVLSRRQIAQLAPNFPVKVAQSIPDDVGDVVPFPNEAAG